MDSSEGINIPIEQSNTTESIFTNMKGKIEVIPHKKKKIIPKTSQVLMRKKKNQIAQRIFQNKKKVSSL